MKEKTESMLLQTIPRAQTDLYMSDDCLKDDRRGRHVDRVEQGFIRQHIDGLAPGAVVLDCPCGNGRLSQWVARRGDLQLVAVDFNFGMLESMQVRELPELLPRRMRGDVFHLPLADNSADLVLHIRLLHHVSDLPTRVRMMAELRRVLKPGGTLITSFWNAHTWRHLRKVIRRQHVKLYPISPAHFRDACAQAGLTVERLVPTRHWIEKQCLAVCHKL